ncbi:MAG TPA: radical SAM protein [Methylomirabilota bacterium]|nr:radical SAM protein [Methylomirabilota bacterium]
MRIGVLDILTDMRLSGAFAHLYAVYFRKQIASIMPQAISVWCRQLGHEVFYSTYFGLGDPRDLMPRDLDILFVSTYTQASALAYALGKLYRRDGVRTVIGGPHARAFPQDCARFFDLVVRDCDQELIGDILAGRFDPPQIVTSGRPLREIPTVRERMPEIRRAAFVRGRPGLASIAPMLSSLGCPYRCDFCVDWNTDYVALPGEQLEADLRYVSEQYPGLMVGFHDPNFAVRFEQTMAILERIPPGRRPGYLMESSLSILKRDRLARLRDTNCVYVAPGIESWTGYSNKAGASGKSGREKLEQVIDHVRLIGDYVPGIQANFLVGSDADRGAEPAELTREFVRRLPGVWPTVNFPAPFGGTPLHDSYMREDRVLRALPFTFYHVPYLAIRPRHYELCDYYTQLISIFETIVSARMMGRRVRTPSHPIVLFINMLRTFAAGRELRLLKRIRRKLASERQFRAFHEGESRELPVFYRMQLRRRLGPYAELLSLEDLMPVLTDAAPVNSDRAFGPRSPRRVASTDEPSPHRTNASVSAGT